MDLSFTQQAQEKLKENRKAWDQNPALRETYYHYYEKLVDGLPAPANTILEIGGGIGNFRDYCPQVVSSDIILHDRVDTVMDALNLPILKNSLDALVMVDVLHHLAVPKQFFEEVQQCLRPGGRLLLIDVYVSFFSYWVLKAFHSEPVDFKKDPWGTTTQVSSKQNPWDANQAIATQLFWNDLSTFEHQFPGLSIIHKETFDWCWPLSGGFSHPAFLPESYIHYLKPMSQWKLFNKLSAFRCFLVIEKQLSTRQ